ncbi:helix-turn-helix domain-containing protein [Actinokineospora pegani]|uniref:helix-turn-helix domain-containing protein n=1 Tax=Actinokineospora pegani TaxID=2654637 RepID=UPI0012EA344E|nr:helix-turn-helix transcriptional regulator [Actinokineospora pegani]
MASEFGERVKVFRNRAGLTQEELAVKAGLGVRTVRGLETGERDAPRVSTIDRLADALGLTAAERAELLGGTAPSAESGVLAEAVARLAHELRARLVREEEQRQIHDPVPLPVRWRAAPAELADSWTNIGMARSGETVAPVRLDGELDQIVAVYRRIRSRRLVVLGRAGAGKTIMTTRFVLGMLDTARPGDPVPVVFTVGSWNPATTALREWMTDQLLRDHPGLAAPGPGETTLAAALVESGRVLPVLDGFDEIASGLHRSALAALNTTTLPMLLTSRPDEFRAAVEGTDVLTAVAAVEIIDLTVDDLAGYLPRTSRKPIWEPVLRRVREQPDGDLAAVFSTPLMVGLARALYSDTPDHDPAELLDADRATIERRLLGGVVPVDDRPTLGFLARHLARMGTHDLAWWQLGSGLATWVRMVVSGVVVGVVVGLLAALVIGVAHGLTGGLAAGVAAGLSAGVAEGFAAGLTAGLAHGAMLAFSGTVFEPLRVRIRLRGGSRFAWRRLLVGLAAGVGMAAGLGIAAELGAPFWVLGWLGGSTPGAVVFGLVFGVVVGVVWGALARFEAPVDISSAVSPMALLNANRRAVVAQAVIFGVLTWVAYSAALLAAQGPIALAYGLVLGVGVGLSVASLTAWGTWVVFGRIWLPLTGRLPRALPAFLETAYRRGVLRRSGAVYQFRHARLQDHLTTGH